jgi:hypothetical protein
MTVMQPLFSGIKTCQGQLGSQPHNTITTPATAATAATSTSAVSLVTKLLGNIALLDSAAILAACWLAMSTQPGQQRPAVRLPAAAKPSNIVTIAAAAAASYCQLLNLHVMMPHNPAHTHQHANCSLPILSHQRASDIHHNHVT